MAGTKNLKSPGSTEEAQEWGKKGGKASGVARRAKRDAKEAALLFLNMAAAGSLDDILGKLDIPKNERTNQMGIIARLTVKAQSGDVQSAKLLLELTGQMPKESAENNFSVNVRKGENDNMNIIVLPPKAPMP
jgi:hypothetical protein